MSIVKSFSVGNGDMFYINHESNFFTTIDCCLNKEKRSVILDEINRESMDKKLLFISTHPDEDHIMGLAEYIYTFPIDYFFCVKNNVTKKDASDDFKAYSYLRNNVRKWLYSGVLINIPNKSSRIKETIKCLWPNKDCSNFQNESNNINLNNLSPIITYTAPNGATFMWMGDLEHNFLKNIMDYVVWPHVEILFAPHHGRESGKVPLDVLKCINPQIIVLGEASSKDLHYNYNEDGFNTLTQNSAGDITFECVDKLVNVYVENENYKVNFLDQVPDYQGIPGYLGSIFI